MTALPAVAGTSLLGHWRGLSRPARGTIALVAGLLAVNALLAGLDAAVGRDPGGPTSSSYATAPGGLAAYADLLERRGHPVHRIRTTLDRAVLDPGATLVVADARDVTDDEATALAGFVSGGGRLLVTGDGAPDVLRRLPVGGLSWSGRRADPAAPIAPVPEVEGVTTVRAAGPGSWRDTGATLAVLGGDGGVLATVVASGRGRVVALADTSPWQNRLLDAGDNAAFALAAAGEPGRGVHFAEAHHGFGAAEGLGALPSRWRWALAGVALAALLTMWAQGRRFGPPEDAERERPPPRRVYVDAVAASLARTRRPADAIRPLQEAARRRLARRAGIPPDADDATVRRAGAHLGLPDDEVAALLGPVRGDDEVVAAGRALARLEGGRW